MAVSDNLVIFLCILGAAFFVLIVFVFHRFLGSRGAADSFEGNDAALRARPPEQDEYMRSVRNNNFNNILYKMRGQTPHPAESQWYAEGMSQMRSDPESDSYV